MSRKNHLQKKMNRDCKRYDAEHADNDDKEADHATTD
jgi:hypothetical protein